MTAEVALGWTKLWKCLIFYSIFYWLFDLIWFDLIWFDSVKSFNLKSTLHTFIIFSYTFYCRSCIGWTKLWNCLIFDAIFQLLLQLLCTCPNVSDCTSEIIGTIVLLFYTLQNVYWWTCSVFTNVYWWTLPRLATPIYCWWCVCHLYKLPSQWVDNFLSVFFSFSPKCVNFKSEEKFFRESFGWHLRDCHSDGECD